jgi:osmotically-inducible protein OsmY
MKPMNAPAFTRRLTLALSVLLLAPLNATETDDRIVAGASINAQLRMALLTHRSTSALRTIVATTNGAVIVGGIARNTAEKELVTKLVTDIHGVKSVVNSMVVKAAVTKN